MSDILWIMRHGEAAPGFPDHERALTRRGREEVARSAAWLVDVLGESTAMPRLVASPYRRAQQTAAIVAERLGVEIETLASITPDDPVEPVIDWLQAYALGASMVLVGHMPLVGNLTARLVDGEGGLGYGFPTAGIACLEAEVWASGCARLREFHAPG